MPDDRTVNESAPAEGSDEGPDGADEVRHDAAAEMKQAVADAEESADSRDERQGPPRTTPTLYEAQRATAAGTPSEEAGKQVRAEFAESREKEQDPDDTRRERHRTAKEIVADGEGPLAPLPGRAEPADQDTGSPADADQADDADRTEES